MGEHARVETIHFLGALVRVDTVISSGEWQRWNGGEPVSYKHLDVYKRQMYPKAWEATGLSYTDLITTLIEGVL